MKISKDLLLVPSRVNPKLANEYFQYNSKYPQIKLQVPTLPIYHYTSFLNAKLIIEGGLLKFSAPSTFNDPFDMAHELIEFKATNKNVKFWIRSVDNGFSNKRKQQLLDDLKLVGLDKFEKEGIKNFSKIKDEFGICCFSEKHDVSLMWSHYADKHKGVALGFDFNIVEQTNNSFMSLRKVQYKSAIEPINYFKRKDEAIAYWLENKSNIWDYEKEVRSIITNRRDHDLFPFKKECLKEIYFGCRVIQSEVDEILNTVNKYGYSPLSLKRMIMDKTTFGVKAADL